ncbi:MAG TPA: hypothetical protein VE441_12550 [Mycobacterium sp.]|nr:hypothetical protein [Mycobacterium sp.]
MTTPDEPDPSAQPASSPAPAQQPEPAAQQPEPAQQAAAPAPATPVPTGQAPAQPPYAQQPDPFAPVARAPKTPWIAPQRKPAVIAIAIAAAVVLLLVGGVSGWAIFDTGNGHPTRNVQFDRPGFGNGPRMFPRGPDGNGRRVIPRIPGTPTPSPSTTS